jgi:hypothetical protein
VLGWFRRRRCNIFRFHDGIRNRAIDPLVAWRAMWEHPTCNPNSDFEPAVGIAPDGSPSKYDPAAQDRVLDMAREMFALRAYSEDSPGLTIEETFNLLWSFMNYMNALKKKPAVSPTPSAASASGSSQPSTTPPESASSSTSSELRSDEPSPSSKRSVRL